MKKEIHRSDIGLNINSVVEIREVDASKGDKRRTEEYHNHQAYQLVVIHRGSAEVICDNILNKLEEKNVILIGSDLPHGVIGFSPDIKATIIHIPYNIINWGIGVSELMSDLEFIKSSNSGYLFTSANTYRRVVTLSNKLKRNYGFGRVSSLYELLSLLSNDLSRKELVANRSINAEIVDTPLSSSIERVYSFLYKNFQKEITLDMVAHHANQNQSALCRAFKRRSGYTIFQFINRLRVERACQLLRSSDLTINQIAYSVGFNSFSHFYTQFMRVVNLSPNEYRKVSNL